MAATIHFFFNEVKPALAARSTLKGFITRQVRRHTGRTIHGLNYIFCSDDYLLEVNRQFLKHDYYTDIITFDLAKSKTGPLEGEIYISIDRVKDNAHTLGTTIKQELHRVIFHGVLHLCGYKDKTKTDQQAMRSKEDEWLALYFKQ